jgi:hypothetical protein
MSNVIRWIRPLGAPRYAAVAAEQIISTTLTPVRLWSDWVNALTLELKK